MSPGIIFSKRKAFGDSMTLINLYYKNSNIFTPPKTETWSPENGPLANGDSYWKNHFFQGSISENLRGVLPRIIPVSR